MVQCQHGGFVMRLTWNSRIIVNGSSGVARGERTSIYFQAQGVEVLVGRFFEELVWFIPWLITILT